ncbi:MAG: alpha/beta hydrolase [Ruminococcaceae bacterium]|nr:alpha/beta hydrolase [Oscillospiraceae bacterium]
MRNVLCSTKSDGIETRELTGISASGEEGLFSRCWLPEKEPRAVIQIAHGMNEHSGRYDRFARFLVSNGFAVFANDHIGHGRSDMGHPRTFSMKKGGFDYLLKDMHTLYDYAMRLYPGLPTALFGHSMGSIAAGLYVERYNEPETLILCGTPLQNPMAGLGGVVAKATTLLKGRTAVSSLLSKAAQKGMSEGEKDPYKAAAWLTRDAAEIEKFVKDPLSGGEFSASAYGELLGALKEFGSVKWAKKVKDIPILVTGGTADTCGGCGKAPKYYYERLIENGRTDVTLKLWNDCRHELLNELNRKDVEMYMLDFLQEKLQLTEAAEGTNE